MRVLKGIHTAAVRAITYSHDGRWLGSGGADGVVGIWDLTGATEPMALRMQAPAEMIDLSFSLDGLQIASLDSRAEVRRWMLATGNCEETQPSRCANPLTIRHGISDFGMKEIWVAGESERRSTVVELRQNGSTRVRLMDAGRPVITAKFSPDYKILAILDSDYLHLYRSPDWACIRLLQPHQQTYFYSGYRGSDQWVSTRTNLACRVDPSGYLLLALGWRKNLQCWKVELPGDDEEFEPGEAPPMVEPVRVARQLPSEITAVELHPQKSQIFSVSEDYVVRVWDWETDTIEAEYQWQRSNVTRLAISPDGMTAASASIDQSIVVWDLE